MRIIPTFFKPYSAFIKKPVILLSLSSIVMSITAVSFAYYSKTTIDYAVDKNDQFYKYGVLLIFILVTQLLFQTFSYYYKSYAYNKLYSMLFKDYYQVLIRGDYQTLKKTHKETYLHLFKQDLMFTSEAIIDVYPKFLFFVLRFLFAFVVLYLVSDVFALLFLGLGLLLLASALLIKKPIRKSHQQALEQESLLFKEMSESLTHLEVIKSFQIESQMSDTIKKTSDDLFIRRMKKQKISVFSSLGMNVFFGFGYAFSIVFGAYQISLGLLSIGSLTAIIQLVSNIQNPFSGLSQLIPKYFQMNASIERLEVLNQIEKEVIIKQTPTKFDKIIFDKVSFSYTDKPVLKDLSLTLDKNKIYWLKGPSGLGKTTLLKLLLGLLEPTEGQILLESESNIIIGKHTRDYFAYVPQDSFLLQQTIKDNLTLGKDVQLETLNKACQIACVLEVINDLPFGYDTILGEGGYGLSNGQRQRLSIARALIKDCPIILLDEATSALDRETETKLLTNLSKLSDKTIVIVSHHDLSDYGFNEIDLLKH